MSKIFLSWNRGSYERCLVYLIVAAVVVTGTCFWMAVS